MWTFEFFSATQHLPNFNQRFDILKEPVLNRLSLLPRLSGHYPQNDIYFMTSSPSSLKCEDLRNDLTPVSIGYIFDLIAHYTFSVAVVEIRNSIYVDSGHSHSRLFMQSYEILFKVVKLSLTNNVSVKT